MSPHYDPQRNPDKDADDMPTLTAERKVKKKFIFIPIIAILLIIAVFSQCHNISRQEAVNIAIIHVGGGIANQPDRDFERFQRVWSVEVFYNELVYEVYVSMRTGDVVSMEIDRWD